MTNIALLPTPGHLHSRKRLPHKTLVVDVKREDRERRTRVQQAPFRDGWLTLQVRLKVEFCAQLGNLDLLPNNRNRGNRPTDGCGDARGR